MVFICEAAKLRRHTNSGRHTLSILLWEKPQAAAIVGHQSATASIESQIGSYGSSVCY